jgi:hypothetical protein
MTPFRSTRLSRLYLQSFILVEIKIHRLFSLKFNISIYYYLSKSAKYKNST